MNLGKAFEVSKNSFDELRLAAAILVLLSHSYALSGNNNQELFYKITNYDTGGGFGVAIFFTISGFLVGKSVMERTTSHFLSSRFLRIIPGLVVASIFEAFLLGPIYTNIPFDQYIKNNSVLSHILNARVFGMDLALPGVFNDLPIPYVNGSLWTLPIECGFYLILPILLLLRLLEKKSSLYFLIFLVASFFIATNYFGINYQNQGPFIWKDATLFSVLRWATVFFMGTCFWIWRASIPMNHGMAVVCLIIMYACVNSVGAHLAYIICVPYLVLYVSVVFKPKFEFKKFGDLSYGAYIYAFPVQQAILASFGADIGPTLLSVLATPVVLFFAWLSWNFVERPALSLVRKSRI